MFAHHLRIIYTKQSGNELILIKDIDDAVISKLTYTLYLKALCSSPRDEKSAAPKRGRRSSIIVKWRRMFSGIFRKI